MPDDQSDPALLARAAEAGFTPGRRDIAPLLAALCDARDDREARVAERALARRADLALDAALAWLAQEAAGGEAARARVARLLGRLGPACGESGSPRAAAALVALLRDSSARVRRQAALAAGRLGTGAPEAALLEAWEGEDQPPVRRGLVEALGKIGSEPALAALTRAAAAATPVGDPEMARLLDRARLTATRSIRTLAPLRHRR